ncbi:MAG TPA: prepilin-type N-terminal cleavage/methylation domain-containing protein [Candidatus Aquicultoraceae bacterium]|nr:prepilin-type N-terminal cleavage/methylation domain-containing protein [Candidatus Aquicultoraceae bacterium]
MRLLLLSRPGREMPAERQGNVAAPIDAERGDSPVAGSGSDGDGGFSLVEVLVAITILVVGLLGLALMQTTAIKANALASRSAIATRLAQDRLEQFKSAVFPAIVSSPTAGYDTGTMTPRYENLPEAAGDSPPPVQGTTFSRVWLVNDVSPTLKRITVWVCWQDDRRIWHNVMLVTQRSDVGV